MAFDWGAAFASGAGSYAAGSSGSSAASYGSSSSGSGYDWTGSLINGILAGASGIAQGKIDRKQLAEQFKYQTQLLQMSLDARREEQERARGYELEDRAYRQGAIGNYAQFAPKTGLLAEKPSESGGSGSAPAAQGSNLLAAASEYGMPEGWQNGDPGNGAVRAAVAHRHAQAAQQAQGSAGSRPGSGLMSDTEGGGIGAGDSGWANGSAGGGTGQAPLNSFGFGGGGSNGPPSVRRGGDPYGNGGRPSAVGQYADEGAAFLAGGFAGPLVGAGVGALVRGFNDPSNPYFGNGNFENEGEVGRNFQGPEAPDQSRQRSNPVSNFLDWLRELVGNE